MLDRQRVLEYLRDWQERPLPKLIHRELKVPKTRKIISIVGPRRAGKTFYFYQRISELLAQGIDKRKILYLNFEDTRLAELNFKEIPDLLKLHYEIYPEMLEQELYIFFDEPQSIKNWEKAVRSLYDLHMHYLFVTGSSSKLLAKEIATALRGRTLTYLLLPFSFKEFLRLRGFKPKRFPYLSSIEEAKAKALLLEHLKFGGFPEVVLESDPSIKLKILQEYHDLLIYRDIVERYKIKNIALIKSLLKHLFAAFSKEFSLHAIFNTLKSQGIAVSKKTLYNYISYIEDALAVFKLRKFSFSVKQTELTAPKVYLADTGFANLVLSFSENIGRIMENAVFLELKRRQAAKELFYWKAYGKEVDFVIFDKKVEQLVQVCYDLNYEVKKREIAALLAASSELKCKNLLVITFDYEKVERHGNKEIKFVPLWKWLLS